ncbi:hypothetical protein D5R81_20185 [Parashewanella spongiae]|uniref:DUF3887 domain-containing protein n=1 Tax=Parashewanella spongiae TaxID=342950 RepID=A0A3A6SPB2_9GAMM|nr:hypothetical protein [Parashewanella spongiae]MCL1080342.1 hypothetical protein [Parashewanella spongiae]RJY00346.1 hypothetical protein D5R81_20185 [Parashewanella spongiae]
MKSLKITFSILFISFLSACVSTDVYIPNSSDMKNADYGSYPSNYQELVKSYMQRRLKDPESAKYRFKGKPIKWYEPSQTLATTVFNYQLTVFINAKNSYGGYAGESEYRFSIKNGVITKCSDITEASSGRISSNWQC